ncbi:aconitase family protein [Sphingobium mellinum]
MTSSIAILAIIAEIGTGGATGHVIEYAGEAIRNLDMAGRTGALAARAVR